MKHCQSMKGLKNNQSSAYFCLVHRLVLCAPCKAIKEKITIWSETHPQVFTGYISIDNDISLAAQENILGAPAILVFVEGKEAIRKIGYFSLEEVFTALDRYISYSE